MSAGSFIQAIIMMVVGLMLLMVMLPVMNSTMTMMSTMNGLNSTSPAQFAAVTQAMQLMPIMMVAALLIAVVGGIAGGISRSPDPISVEYTGTSQREVDTQRELEESIRRANQQIQRSSEQASRPNSRGQPQGRREELMELDLGSMAPATQPKHAEPVKAQDAPKPVEEKPAKSRWESLE